MDELLGGGAALPESLANSVSVPAVNAVSIAAENLVEPTLQQRHVYLGDVNTQVSEQMIIDVLSVCGEIENVILYRNELMQKTGDGEVWFKKCEAAIRCRNMFDNATIFNKLIRVELTKENTNLFIGDLDTNLTDEDLRSAFRVFGPLYESDTYIKHNKYGFARFKYRKDAEVARVKMDGAILGDRAIRTGWGDSSTQKYSLHFQFDMKDLDKINKACIHAAFEPFGTIEEIMIPENKATTTSRDDLATSKDSDTLSAAISKFSIDDNNNITNADGTSGKIEAASASASVTATTGSKQRRRGRKSRKNKLSRGFGFVHYKPSGENHHAVEQAIKHMNGKQVNGVVLICNFGKLRPVKEKEKKKHLSNDPFRSNVRRNLFIPPLQLNKPQYSDFSPPYYAYQDVTSSLLDMSPQYVQSASSSVGTYLFNSPPVQAMHPLMAVPFPAEQQQQQQALYAGMVQSQYAGALYSNLPTVPATLDPSSFNSGMHFPPPQQQQFHHPQQHQQQQQQQQQPHHP